MYLNKKKTCKDVKITGVHSTLYVISKYQQAFGREICCIITIKSSLCLKLRFQSIVYLCQTKYQ